MGHGPECLRERKQDGTTKFVDRGADNRSDDAPDQGSGYPSPVAEPDAQGQSGGGADRQPDAAVGPQGQCQVFVVILVRKRGAGGVVMGTNTAVVPAPAAPPRTKPVSPAAIAATGARRARPPATPSVRPKTIPNPPYASAAIWSAAIDLRRSISLVIA